MVFVSHNMAAVELVCDRVALLDAGRLVAVDSPKPVIAEYRKSSRAVM
jgi:ABC-type polysaccharide/polyol phosphate transport system ATPase subunit